jgi:hypothetical protein
MEKCGDGWYCRNPECGYNYSLVRRASHSDNVLDELENWVRDAMSRAENPKGWLFRTGDMLEKFAELRQQTKEEP